MRTLSIQPKLLIMSDRHPNDVCSKQVSYHVVLLNEYFIILSISILFINNNMLGMLDLDFTNIFWAKKLRLANRNAKKN